ncbi:hypothetical protein CYMTET_28773 [Cymbomonas tetramitiformis]|uniref:Enoyl reductase (ER) domain-containing protein n=1 Tax=Cymbomonas tetramitiformis TaxID=36881 RepID=A0AAE0KVK3_9CHLO|nr:hypothetical protein CYMTET_28773 [Cymbomonas tetramitiformis]
MDPQVVRRINVIECLQEDNEDVPPPPEDAAELWTEEEIHAYFESGGEIVPAPKKKFPQKAAKMKAMRIHKLGGLEQLQLETDLPTPAAGAGEVVIKSYACGVNFSDTLIAAGKYNVRPPLPFSPGFEMAGEVVEIGAEVDSKWQVGDRVVGQAGWGGYAEYAVVKAKSLVPVPDSLDYCTAAAFPVAYATSHIALSYKARLQPGETLLVHGASGGVGLTAVELGAAMGATVIATASTEAKLQIAKSRGAHHGVLSSAKDMHQQVLKLTDEKGVDVVYDPVGGECWDASMKCIGFEGRLLVIGFASGKVPQIPANQLLAKNIDVLGFYIGAYFNERVEVAQKSFEECMEMLMQGKIKPLVSDTYPLEQTATAIALVRDRKAVGKVVVTIGNSN